MANTASARKRARQNVTRRQHNMSQRSSGRTAIKKVIQSIEEKNLEQAVASYKQAQSLLDALVSKGVFSKNKISRHKSRLNKRIKLLKESQ